MGGCVDLAGERTPDLLICDDPVVATLEPKPADVVLVTLAALARAHPGPGAGPEPWTRHESWPPTAISSSL